MSSIQASLILIAASVQPPTYTCEFVKVTDGDTVKITCPQFPEMFKHLSVRVMGIDTPESRMPPAKCSKEVKLGLIAKQRMRQRFNGAKTVTFTWAGVNDKYGGRVLGYVKLPDGKDWAKVAIADGLARPYGLDGSLTKSDWCR